jgi:LmbE family N-acetylglucosaminyl deacetylase
MTTVTGVPQPLQSDSLGLPAGGPVVVTAPHPDDFDAVAVTLRNLAVWGHPLFLAVCTFSPGGVEDSFPGAADAATKARIREQEQRDSCRLFGLDLDHVRFLDLAEDDDGHPRDTLEAGEVVRDLFLEWRPALVILPHGNDTNPGHRRVWRFCRRALASTGMAPVVLLSRDPKTVGMREDFYTPFDQETAAWKAELLGCHRSQDVRNWNTRGHSFAHRILEVNRAAADRVPGCGAPFAETFELWQSLDRGED